MKILLSITLTFILFSTSYPQMDAADFEIFTQTSGSTGDTVRFWMLSVAPVWYEDGTSGSLDDQRLTSSFDSAHATYWNDESRTGVPVPDSSNNYGLWHVLSGAFVAHPNHKYGYGKYKFLIGDEFNNPDMYFYIDYTDCDYTDHYNGQADIWMRYNTDSNFCEISWASTIFLDPTRIEQNEHPTLGIWDYKEKEQGFSGQNTSYLELYLTVSTQNGHPYLSWNAYDERGGNNNVDYYEIWKKETTNWSLLDATSNTYYEDTSEDATPPGVKTYVYYKIRAIELDEDESLFGNQVRTAVYGPTQDTKIDPLSENSIDGWPTVYTLRQNYPNPFNPTTTISFDLAKKSTVHLQIFDIRGKVILTLINKKMDKGTHSVQFNSNGLPSGIYFYRLQTEEFTDIKRMLLLK
jgi:hypothetical protein